MRTFIHGMVAVALIFSLVGCSEAIKKRNKPKSYAYPEIEVEWVRNGEPIMFEGNAWYPTDTIEIFLDNEMYRMGEYRGVEYFVDKQDVRPYGRLYTKFSKNKFRAFKKTKTDDKRHLFK